MTAEERATDFRKKYLCGVMGQKEMERHIREAVAAEKERAAGIAEDACIWDAKPLGDGTPCSCRVCDIAQKIRGKE